MVKMLHITLACISFLFFFFFFVTIFSSFSLFFLNRYGLPYCEGDVIYNRHVH